MQDPSSQRACRIDRGQDRNCQPAGLLQARNLSSLLVLGLVPTAACVLSVRASLSIFSTVLSRIAMSGDHLWGPPPPARLVPQSSPIAGMISMAGRGACLELDPCQQPILRLLPKRAPAVLVSIVAHPCIVRVHGRRCSGKITTCSGHCGFVDSHAFQTI
jgi:hypothetical protein